MKAAPADQKPAAHDSRLLSYAQVAERLGLSVDSVRRYLAAGELPFLSRKRFSRKTIRFTADSVERQVRAFDWNGQRRSKVA